MSQRLDGPVYSGVNLQVEGLHQELPLLQNPELFLKSGNVPNI